MLHRLCNLISTEFSLRSTHVFKISASSSLWQLNRAQRTWSLVMIVRSEHQGNDSYESLVILQAGARRETSKLHKCQ